MEGVVSVYYLLFIIFYVHLASLFLSCDLWPSRNRDLSISLGRALATLTQTVVAPINILFS